MINHNACFSTIPLPSKSHSCMWQAKCREMEELQNPFRQFLSSGNRHFSERYMNQIIRQINVKSQLWERLQRRTLSNEHERRSDLEGKVRENFLEEAGLELRSKGWVTLSRQRGTGKDTLPSLISSASFVSWRNCVRRNLFPWGWGNGFHPGWILPMPESLLWA